MTDPKTRALALVDELEHEAMGSDSYDSGTAIALRLAITQIPTSARVGHLLDEMDEWIGRAGEAERLAEERLAHANQLQADIEDEMQGRLALRKRLGAREDETMGTFLERLATMAGVVPADVHEHGWQWRPTDADTAFAPPFGTIRQCRVCGCLVAGGPTTCARCAEAGA